MDIRFNLFYNSIAKPARCCTQFGNIIWFLCKTPRRGILYKASKIMCTPRPFTVSRELIFLERTAFIFRSWSSEVIHDRLDCWRQHTLLLLLLLLLFIYFSQYRLMQSGKTASGSCSAGPRFVRACSATDLFYLLFIFKLFAKDLNYWCVQHIAWHIGISGMS